MGEVSLLVMRPVVYYTCIQHIIQTAVVFVDCEYQYLLALVWYDIIYIRRIHIYIYVSYTPGDFASLAKQR